MSDQLELDVFDPVQATKKLSENLNMYSTLHIRKGSRTGRWYVCERNYPGVEVDWTWLFEVSYTDAHKIVESGYADWWK